MPRHPFPRAARALGADSAGERSRRYLLPPRMRPYMAGKKWLRAPIYGPCQIICYDCGTPDTVTYFAAVRNCGACGGRRFVPRSIVALAEKETPTARGDR